MCAVLKDILPGLDTHTTLLFRTFCQTFSCLFCHSQLVSQAWNDNLGYFNFGRCPNTTLIEVSRYFHSYCNLLLDGNLGISRFLEVISPYFRIDQIELRFCSEIKRKVLDNPFCLGISGRNIGVTQGKLLISISTWLSKSNK